MPEQIDPIDIVQVAVRKGLRLGPGDAFAFRVQNGRALVQIALRERQAEFFDKTDCSDAK